ncbi:MAG: bifunctional riboflavin kinase/FAD synthetase [Sporolactobacillus sp.]
MKTIQLTERPAIDAGDSREKVIALGYFDGVHLGHQQVIRAAVDIARERGLLAAVMTFYPHPSAVLKPSVGRRDSLTPPPDKERLLAELGVNLLFEVRFTLALSRLSPQEFVDAYLINLHAKHIVAGFDYTFGRMALGNMENMSDYSRSMFDYTIIPRVERFGEKISSTRIRNLIGSGAVDRAALLLGRPYRTTGIVIRGDQRGRKLGFPTANIESELCYPMPTDGVYAVRLHVDNQTYAGIGSIGSRPTFYADRSAGLAVEVHLLDFDGDIYGRHVAVDWYVQLRTQKKFSGESALIDQMKKDRQQTRQFFAANEHRCPNKTKT